MNGRQHHAYPFENEPSVLGFFKVVYRVLALAHEGHTFDHPMPQSCKDLLFERNSKLEFALELVGKRRKDWESFDGGDIQSPTAKVRVAQKLSPSLGLT